MTNMTEAEPISDVQQQRERRQPQAQETRPSAARWAWSIPVAEFDWMDDHQPFVDSESL